ncbi:MAG: DUF11 domain-containing protein [Alphaproteobacteria bacterium]|nr:DUF11 domain-containing protein [Alphaproteobacteria bacterium]
MRSPFFVLSAAALLAGAAFAASPMSVTTLVEKEVVVRDTKGGVKVNRIPALTVVPGDTVVYTYNLKNGGKAPSENIIIVAPIPAQMKYIDKSATTQSTIVTFSVDAGKSFGEAAKLEVTDKDGKRRPAGAGDYTHIRWVMSVPLDGGTARAVAFRAVLE